MPVDEWETKTWQAFCSFCIGYEIWENNIAIIDTSEKALLAELVMWNEDHPNSYKLSGSVSNPFLFTAVSSLLNHTDFYQSIWGILLLFLIPIYSSMPTENGFQHIASKWIEPGSSDQAIFEWPEDLSGGIRVVPIHSHNDYWRRVPLFDAIAVGCTGVEADVWLKNGSLLVGHSEDSLNANRTLHSLYIDPLLQILEHQNSRHPVEATPHGVFDSSPKTSLALLIDIKTDGISAWPTLQQQIEPLRSKGWLTYHNGTTLFPGPVTVVGTGNTPFSLILNDTTNKINDTDNAIRRDFFFDAPLDNLSSSIYNASNSYYASVSLRKAVGRTWFGTLSARQSKIIEAQTRLATRFGLKARYWDTQAWPVGWRSRVWDALIGRGVSMLNADDVVAASQWDWNRCTVLGMNVC